MRRQFVFKWNAEELSVGVKKMDEDHEVLIGLMNDVYSLHLKGASRNMILDSLKQLGGFVVEHFTREEALFDRIPGYMDMDIHKAIHRKLVQRYSSYVTLYEDGRDLDDDFFFFLKAWLVAHIEGVDMKYGVLTEKESA